jgi:hypothetical protein
MDKSPPKNMPDYVKLYPGSAQMMNMSMGPITADVVTTTDTPATVLTYYRTQAAGSGLTEGAAPASASVGATAGQEQAMFSDASGKMLIVSAKPQGTSGTMVTLSWKTPPGNS